MTFTRAGFIGTVCAALGFPKQPVLKELRSTESGLPLDVISTTLESAPRADVVTKAQQVALPSNISKLLAKHQGKVGVPEMPPPTGRNPGACFGCSSFDEVRLAELIDFMSGIGFGAIQYIVTERDRADFGFTTIKFGQVADPRLPAGYWDTHDFATGKELTAQQIAAKKEWRDMYSAV